MNLAAFLADKCLAYLLQNDSARQQKAGRRTPLQPPWSPAAETFHALCTGCGDCAAACPNKIIVLAEDSQPVLDFSQGFCTFCGDCARSCPTGALRFDADKAPWSIRARIETNCLLGSRVLCRNCGDHCVKGAIRFPLAEGRLPSVLTEQCSGCGACAGVCPVNAILFSDGKTQ